MTHAEVLLELGFSIYFLSDGYGTSVLLIDGLIIKNKPTLRRCSMQFDSDNEETMLQQLDIVSIVMFRDLQHFLKSE